MIRAGARARASGPKHRRLRQLIAAYCSLLQLIAAYCSLLQLIARAGARSIAASAIHPLRASGRLLQLIAAYCSLLQLFNHPSLTRVGTLSAGCIYGVLHRSLSSAVDNYCSYYYCYRTCSIAHRRWVDGTRSIIKTVHKNSYRSIIKIAITITIASTDDEPSRR